MTVELTPLGNLCNLSCGYCYQNPMRDAGNMGNERPYDFDKMFKALTEEGGKFSVFGGEALLVPLPDLIKIFAWGFERNKENGLQTNGTLITPAHIEAFLKYDVHVGFSLDGPDELNDSRWAGTIEKTREQSAKSHANLKACIEAGVGTSVIVSLYKGNAQPETLPRLKEWIVSIDRMGVRGVRIHLLEVDHPIVKAKMQLTEDQNIIALRELVALEREHLTKTANLGEYPTREAAELARVGYSGLPQYPRLGIFERKENNITQCFVLWHMGLELDILTDMRKLLRADDDSVSCVWNVCDSYTTSAVRGVNGQGEKSNCGRTNKDGITRLKAEKQGFERQLALYNTPHEDGGCKSCRFFLMCKGQCPGTAIDGDWRNRTADCKVWFTLFQDLETEMMFAGGTEPLSISPIRPQLEAAMLGMWERGQTTSLKQALIQLKKGQKVTGASGAAGHGDVPHGDSHGDHTDAELLALPPTDVPHGDVPHGDTHGDHTDTGQQLRGIVPVGRPVAVTV